MICGALMIGSAAAQVVVTVRPFTKLLETWADLQEFRRLCLSKTARMP